MNNNQIAIELDKYNEIVNNIENAGDACILNSNITDNIDSVTKCDCIEKLSLFYSELYDSSKNHRNQIAETLPTSLKKIKNVYEEVDRTSEKLVNLQ